MSRRSVLLAIATLGAVPAMLQGQESKPKPNYARDLITREEIRERAHGARDAMQVVQQLRPHFLHERVAGSMATGAQRQPVQIYVDGVRSGVTPAVALR